MEEVSKFEQLMEDVFAKKDDFGKAIPMQRNKQTAGDNELNRDRTEICYNALQREVL